MSSFIIRRNIRLLSSASKKFVKPCSIVNNGRVLSAQFITPSTTTRRLFSSSPVAQDLPEVKQALFTKLTSEIDVENETPVKIAEEDEIFLKNANFAIDHKIGEKIVTLTKKLPDGGNLKIYFDCTELNDIQSSASPEVEESQEGAEESEFEDQLENSLLNVNIIVENPATNESLVAHSYLSYDELEFFPQSFQIIKDIELANSLTAESQQIKLSKYNGPGFQMLDEEVQELFVSYFEELGCNEQLGEFIVNYSTVVENDEYIHWLKDLKGFFN